MGKKGECDLVNAHGDRFWELGRCICEFPGGRRETSFVVEVEEKQALLWRDDAGFPILQSSLFMNLALGITRGMELET